MGADPGRSGALVVDASALQSPATRLRGIGRYALGWCRALDAAAPGLIGRYLLDPDLPPLPGEAVGLVASGRVRYRDAPDAMPAGARAFHTFSLLDPAVSLAQCWPDVDGIPRDETAGDAPPPGLARSVTVFDCIPAGDPRRLLADPIDRRRYLARFSLVRAADRLQVLSQAVADDLQRHAGVAAGRVAVVGAAADERFAPPASRLAARLCAAAAVPELERPYVLYPSGSHPRKNNEALILAWARLPQRLLEEMQLVITGEMPAPLRRHYHLLAERLGLRGRVLVPGDVDDEAYLLLIQGADLVCFPSLAEGFGLPVAEALSCGTPVIASNRPPFEELLPPGRRFDPTSPAAIALGIGQVLLAGRAADDSPADTAPGPPPLNWSEVGRRSLEAFGVLLDELPRRRAVEPGGAAVQPGGAAPRRGRRRRLAVVSPFPPAASGVATYTYRLVEELRNEGSSHIDLYADGPTQHQHGPEGLSTEPASTLITLEALGGRYDHIIYTIGNSHHHLGALDLLRRRPGVVLCHDVRLGNLYIAEHGDLPQSYRSLPRAVRRLYGPTIPEDVGRGTVFTPEQQRRFGLLLAREVIELSERYLVSSSAARELALSDVAGRFEERVAILPFALEAPAVPDPPDAPDAGAGAPRSSDSGDSSEAARATLPEIAALGGAALVAHFGIVDPAKQPSLLVEAFSRLRRPPDEGAAPAPRLAFVGPIADSLAEQLRAEAEELGMADALLLSGVVPPALFRAFVERATVAVQLRSQFNGEASAAVGQCLACGVPTVVSDLGWMSELPDAAVVKVPAQVPAASLAATLGDLLADAARREELSQAAREVARRQGFDVTARALLEVLDELAPAR